MLCGADVIAEIDFRQVASHDRRSSQNELSVLLEPSSGPSSTQGGQPVARQVRRRVRTDQMQLLVICRCSLAAQGGRLLELGVADGVPPPPPRPHSCCRRPQPQALWRRLLLCYLSTPAQRAQPSQIHRFQTHHRLPPRSPPAPLRRRSTPPLPPPVPRQPAAGVHAAQQPTLRTEGAGQTRRLPCQEDRCR